LEFGITNTGRSSSKLQLVEIQVVFEKEIGKMILFENIIVHLSLSEEADTGSGGDRLARNSLTEWNRKGSASSPILFFYSNCLCLKKRFVSIETTERKIQLLTRKKVNTERDKTKCVRDLKRQKAEQNFKDNL
jgi:hypothetical protein